MAVAGALHAQVDTATIVGTVQDSSGQWFRAHLSPPPLAQRSKRPLTLDSSGAYVMTPLKIGGYKVTSTDNAP